MTVNMPDVGANDSRLMQFGADGVGENTQFQTYAFAIESSWRYNNGNRVFAGDPLDLPSANIGVWLSTPGTNYGQKEFYRNGTTAATQTGANNPNNVSNLLDEGLGVGGAWVPNNGDVAAPSRFLTGDLAEVLVFDRDLTADEMNQVGYYLQTKWAVAAGTFTPEPATLALIVLGAVPLLRRRR